jgi:hypothetical protein
MSKPYKLILAIFELLLAIPFLGAILVISHKWTPLLVLFVLHAIGIFLAFGEHKRKGCHILGMVTNALAWIPILGMLLHAITGIALLFDFFTESR